MSQIRSPICVVLGHVDHGKSSILDKIRGTAIINTEPGKITQSIGASIVPLSTVEKICGELLKSLNMDFTIPGLLFVDTPGHAAFTSLRKRGGNLADIAVVVVDINEGFKPQTIEAIELLKSFKTPFVIAANKLDLVPGWKTQDKKLLVNISKQAADVQTLVDTRLYELVGKLHEITELQSERFDRVDDYTKQIAIIPTSASTGEGIPELLMVISGLAQRYLEQCLECNVKGNAKGTILEVKQEVGLGITVDVIVYDGTLNVNDTIVIGGVDRPIVSKVRALLEPAPLAEMRDKKTKFKSVKNVAAATGVKISAPDIEEAVAGMPIRSCSAEDVEQVKEEVQKEVKEVLMETEKQGIVIKGDTLGSLEALSLLLKEKGIPVRKAAVGNISKKDITDAQSMCEKDELCAMILGFNVDIGSDVEYDENASPIKIITNNVIYKLIEDMEKWQEERKKAIEKDKLCLLISPCRLKIMPNYVFRQSNPAIVGVDVESGKLRTGTQLMKKDGKAITTVKSIQAEKERLSELEKNKQAAISLDKVTVGRQINEGDVLYSYVSESDFRKMKELKKLVPEDQKEVLKEIAEIMRKENPVWGI